MVMELLLSIFSFIYVYSMSYCVSLMVWLISVFSVLFYILTGAGSHMYSVFIYSRTSKIRTPIY